MRVYSRLHGWWTRAAAIPACAALATLGSACAGPGPRPFPVGPLDGPTGAGTANIDSYDTDGDGSVDYAVGLGEDGMVAVLRYDLDGDGAFDLDAVPPALRTDRVRHLVIILDSVPYESVRQMRARGRFRLFHAPSRIISPFPVMTDVCLAEFFDASPCAGMESQYFDGHALNAGYWTYAGEGNAPWQARVGYYLANAAHLSVYLDPQPWFDHELRAIQDRFVGGGNADLVAYCVGTSALGAKLGRDGHLAGLIRLDRLCQWIVHRTRGRVQITLMSDHGHVFTASRRIDLGAVLRDAGYRVGTRLQRPGDVVVPGFGMVTCAAIYTRDRRAVARDVVGAEGVELAAYLNDAGDVVVVGRDATATIQRRGDRYRYGPVSGDPLGLARVVADLEARGASDDDGFVGDEDWFQATLDHAYPDVIHRLWRAFHGLLVYPPDVFVSIRDGYHSGSALMTRLIGLRASHGSLRAEGSTGFVMSTAGRVADVIRMEDLRAALIGLGVPLE